MSRQHVEQLITGWYDYRAANWSTPESRYARRYFAWITAGCPGAAPRDPRLTEAARADVRRRVDRELARPV